MNFSALRQSLEDWLNRPELVESAPLFLNFANTRLNRELNAWEMEATTDVTVATGEELNTLAMDFMLDGYVVRTAQAWEMIPGTVVLPDDFNKIRQVSIAGVGTYEAATIGQIAELSAAEDESRRVFAVDAGRITLWPTPVGGTVVRIDYYVMVPALSDTVQTNIFTENYSDLLLWAAIVEACNYLGEDARAQIFEAKYQASLEVSNQKPKRVKFGSTPLRRDLRIA